jgi:hypothetical protein
LADYNNGVTPAAGQTFGTYNPAMYPNNSGSLNPDGGDPWTVPSAGAAIGLVFYTQADQIANGASGGQPEYEGFANFVVAAVPEPTSLALVVVGAGLSCLLLWRKRA